MRTTLSIDDDILAVAKNLSRESAQPIGKVLSDLARRGLQATPRIGKRERSGFPVFKVPANAKPITLEDVKKIEDEM